MLYYVYALYLQNDYLVKNNSKTLEQLWKIN